MSICAVWNYTSAGSSNQKHKCLMNTACGSKIKKVKMSSIKKMSEWASVQRCTSSPRSPHYQISQFSVSELEITRRRHHSALWQVSLAALLTWRCKHLISSVNNRPRDEKTALFFAPSHLVIVTLRVITSFFFFIQTRHHCHSHLCWFLSSDLSFVLVLRADKDLTEEPLLCHSILNTNITFPPRKKYLQLRQVCFFSWILLIRLMQYSMCNEFFLPKKRSKSAIKRWTWWRGSDFTWLPSCPIQRTLRRSALARLSSTSRSLCEVWRSSCSAASSSRRNRCS